LPAVRARFNNLPPSKMHPVDSNIGFTSHSLVRRKPGDGALSFKPSDREKRAVWRNQVAHEHPDPYPCPPFSDPVDTGVDVGVWTDFCIMHKSNNWYTWQPYHLPYHFTTDDDGGFALFEAQTTIKDDLGFALLKARRLECQAEKHLVQRCVKQIDIEKEYYNNIEHETGQKLHTADVHVGLAHAVGDKQNCCGMFTYLHKHASH